MSRALAHRVRRLEKRPIDVDAFSQAIQEYVERGVLPRGRLAREVVRFAKRVDDHFTIQDQIAHEAVKGEQV